VRVNRVAVILGLFACFLSSGCSALTAPSPQEFKANIVAIAPMARNVEVRAADIDESNCPVSVGKRRGGYVATYEIDGLPGVRGLIQADKSADLFECSALPHGAVGLTDVDFFRIARAVSDEAQLKQIAGVLPLTDGWLPDGVTVVGDSFAAADCYVVGETIPALVPGGDDSDDAHVVYLDPATLDAQYLGPLRDVVP